MVLPRASLPHTNSTIIRTLTVWTDCNFFCRRCARSESPRASSKAMLGSRFLPRLGITVQLMTLRDRLANARRGVDRLRHAVAKAGSGAYAALCQGLGVSGRSINEIPDMRRLPEFVDKP